MPADRPVTAPEEMVDRIGRDRLAAFVALVRYGEPLQEHHFANARKWLATDAGQAAVDGLTRALLARVRAEALEGMSAAELYDAAVKKALDEMGSGSVGPGSFIEHLHKSVAKLKAELSTPGGGEGDAR